MIPITRRAYIDFELVFKFQGDNHGFLKRATDPLSEELSFEDFMTDLCNTRDRNKDLIHYFLNQFVLTLPGK